MARDLGEFLPGPQYEGVNKAIISGLGATSTLLPSQSGGVILFDAASQVFTLPKPSIGLQYDFVSTITSSTNQEVDTDAATTFILGSVEIGVSNAATGTAQFANGTGHVKIAMNGTTTGGIIGSWFRLTCVTATQWQCVGLLNGSGSTTTPFA